MQERTRRPSHRGNTGGPDRALQRRERFPFPVSCRPDPTVRPAATRSSPTTLPCPLRRGSNERRGCPPQPRRSFIACAGRGRPDAGDRRAITGGNHTRITGESRRAARWSGPPAALRQGPDGGRRVPRWDRRRRAVRQCVDAVLQRDTGTPIRALRAPRSRVLARRTAAWCAPPQRRCGSPGAWFRPHTWHIGIL